MKKFMFILTVVLFSASITTQAQYSVNKTMYDFRQYVPEVGDPYNPGVAGIASFFIPGLGQMISNEGGRGAGFLGGYVGCWVVYGIGVGSMSNDIAMDGYYDGAGAGLVLLGIGGALVVNIWSIVDATRVAKVNNMAWRDRNMSSSIRVQPELMLSPNGKPISGMSLSFKF